MEVIVGTYEELILGYKLVKNSEGYVLDQTFTDHSHIGCVRAIDVSPRKILASGSSDEVIRLFNLKSRRELGNLMHHEGTILSLHFYGKNHMFSTSDDGSIGVWKTGKWECLRTLRGHKGPVYDLSVHPSGKLAVSISKDKTMKTWNLLTGKCAYTTSIKTVADSVVWSPDGSTYAIVINNRIDLYKVETGTVYYSIQCDFRIHPILFLKDDILAVSGDGGEVHFYNISTKQQVGSFSTDTNRVKGLSKCEGEEGSQLVTASSDGFIKIWSLLPFDGSWGAELIVAHDTKFRLISLAVCPDKKSSPPGDTTEQKPLVESHRATQDKEQADTDEDMESSEEEKSSSEEEAQPTIAEKAGKESGKKRKQKKNQSSNVGQEAKKQKLFKSLDTVQSKKKKNKKKSKIQS